LLEKNDHFLDRDDIGIIGDRIGFLKSMPSVPNLLYPGPPCQGSFTDVVSGDMEGDGFKVPRPNQILVPY